MTAGADEQVLTARWVFRPRPRLRPRNGHDPGPHRLGRCTRHAVAGYRLRQRGHHPRPVNAHLHLDFRMRGKNPPAPDFVDWLRGVICTQRTRTAEQTADDIKAGLDECLRFGTTLVGDIAAGGASWDSLTKAPLWAVCFREVLCLPAERVHAVWAELCRWVESHPDTPTCRAGVSPHAPYSVHRTLIEAAARLWPVSIHLAESPAERELLEDHSGPFVRFLQDLNVWDPDGLAPNFDWVLWKASRAPSALFAHGNLLEGRTRLSANSTVVYCPRTHAAFGDAIRSQTFNSNGSHWHRLAGLEPDSTCAGALPPRISGAGRTAFADGDGQRPAPASRIEQAA